MADPIGKGDWVECIDHTPVPGFSRAHILAGRLYRVSRVGSHRIFGELLWLDDALPSAVGGYLIRRFRPIYRRRDAEALTAKLLVGARAKGPLVPAQVEREGSRETVK